MILDKLAKIITDARDTWEHAVPPCDMTYDAVMDSYAGVRQDAVISGRLITSDNLGAAKTLLAATNATTEDAPRLIYMDPPFFTKAKYSAQLRLKTKDGGQQEIPLEHFSDRWNREPDSDDFSTYLTSVSARILAAYDLLPDDGVLWLHIDHHAVHYLKVLTDEIFGGPEHLINEVIWQYKSGGSSKRRFAHKHDTLLFYAKNPKKYLFTPLEEKSYNRGRKPYSFKGVKEYRDEGGWYTLIGMRDVWQIDMVGRTAHERTGYATQKPEALIERIIESCTAPGDLCADLYGGSGTLAAVCDELGRRWLSVDSNPVAALHAEKRMTGRGAAFELLTGRNILEAEAGDGAEDNVGEMSLRPQGRNPLSDSNGLRVKPAMTVPFPNSLFVPEITVAVQLQDTFDPGKKLVTIDVTGYDPPEGLESVLPSEFIAGISADIYAENEIFTPQRTVYGQSRLDMMIDSEVIRREKEIKVRIIDIFGRHFTIHCDLT